MDFSPASPENESALTHFQAMPMKVSSKSPLF
jgi:hypothetical protein